MSVDATLVAMAARDLIPTVEGLSPLEAAGLVHAEAQFVAKRLALRALADGRNLLFDMSMASPASVQSWLAALHRAGYTAAGLFADIGVEEWPCAWEFPCGDVTGLLAAYAAGQRSWEDVIWEFRARRWPLVPPVCPPGLVAAAPAIDDPEPYVPGSFDDVVRACDLGQLSDAEYEAITGAITG